MALQLRRGHTSSLGKTIATSFAVLALIVQPFAAVTIQKASAASGGDPCTATNTFTDQAALRTELASGALGEVCLGSSMALTAPLTISRALTVYGQGNVVSPVAGYSGSDNLILISAGHSTVNNLVVDGSVGGSKVANLQGIQVYSKNAGQASATLNNVEARNHSKAGIHANGAAITVNNVKTSNNGATNGGIHLGKGSGVAVVGSVTVTGQSVHTSEPMAIYTDKNGAVTDNGQYNRSGLFGYYAWTLKAAPAAPSITTPASGSTITASSTTAQWAAVSGSTTVQSPAKYEYRVDGGMVEAVPVPATTAELTGLTNGSHTFEVRSVAASGAASAWASTTFTANVNQVPTLTVATPTEGSYASTKPSGNKLRITGTFTDDVKANYATFQLVYRGNSKAIGTIYGYGSVFNPAATYADAAGNYSYDLAVPADLEDGEYSLFYTGTDFTGGITSRMERKIFIDNKAPTFAIITPSNGSTVNGTQRISATITDVSDITKVLMNVGDGKGSYVWEAGKSNNKVTRDGDTFYIDIDTATLPEGASYVVLRATDGAGNTRYYNNNAGSRQHSYNVDNTAPVVTLDDVAAITVGDKAILTGSVDDATVTEVEVTVGDRPMVVVPVSGGTFSYEIEDLAVGVHDISVQARDALGNASQAAVKSVTVSARPPVVTPGGNQGSGNGNGSNGEVPATADDDDTETDADAANQVFTAPVVALGNQAVLGDQNAAQNQRQSDIADDVSDQDVQGATDEKQDGAFSPLGFAWYWWLVALAAITGLLWLLAALRRRKDEE